MPRHPAYYPNVVVWTEIQPLVPSLTGSQTHLIHPPIAQRELRGNEREAEVLDRLTNDGVRVRVCKDSEKLAVAGGGAWLGSANSTATSRA